MLLWQLRECTALGEQEEGQTRRCGVRQGCRERGSGGAETPPSHLAGLGPGGRRIHALSHRERWIP